MEWIKLERRYEKNSWDAELEISEEGDKIIAKVRLYAPRFKLFRRLLKKPTAELEIVIYPEKVFDREEHYNSVKVMREKKELKYIAKEVWTYLTGGKIPLEPKKIGKDDVIKAVEAIFLYSTNEAVWRMIKGDYDSLA